MRITKPYNARVYRLTRWHRWFAWYPVRLRDPADDYSHTDQIAWLEVVQRKGTCCDGWMFFNHIAKDTGAQS